MRLNSSQKGQIAQLKCQLEANLRGYICSLPTTPQNFDVLLTKNQETIRTQIKYCNCLERKNKKRLRLKLGGSTFNRKYYTKNNFDMLLVYVPSVDKILAYHASSFHKRATILINLKDKRSINYFEKYIW